MPLMASNQVASNNITSHQLSDLMQQGLLWQAERVGAPVQKLTPQIKEQVSKSSSPHSTAAQDYSAQTYTAQTYTAQTYTGQTYTVQPSQMHFSRQQFLECGLPLGAVHEWCTTLQVSRPNGSKSPPAKSSCSAAPPLSIITAILRANLVHSTQSNTLPDPRLILWIGRNCWPTPHLLAQASHSGVDLLSRSLFIDPPDSKTKLWAIDAALRSKGVFGVIAQCRALSTTMSRRFSLAASQGGTIGFIVRPEKEFSLPSAAMSRWKVSPALNSVAVNPVDTTQSFAAKSPSSAAGYLMLHPRWQIELTRCKGSFIPPATLPIRWFVEVCDEISLSFPSELVSGVDSTQQENKASYSTKRLRTGS